MDIKIFDKYITELEAEFLITSIMKNLKKFGHKIDTQCYHNTLLLYSYLTRFGVKNQMLICSGKMVVETNQFKGEMIHTWLEVKLQNKWLKLDMTAKLRTKGFKLTYYPNESSISTDYETQEQELTDIKEWKQIVKDYWISDKEMSDGIPAPNII